MPERKRIREYYQSVRFGRQLVEACKVFWHILVNRPIVVYYNDGSMYARSNPVFLAEAAKDIAEIAEEQAARIIEAQIQNLLTIPNHRNN